MILSDISHVFPTKVLTSLDMILSHIYHLLSSNVMALFGYTSVRYLPFASHKSTDIIWIWFSHYCHLFSSKILTPFGSSSVTYLPFIFLINTGIIRICFCHAFTINLPLKYWNYLDMILPHIYHLFPSKVMALFGYASVRYLPFASHKSTDIIWIWFSHYCHLFSSKILTPLGNSFVTYLPFISLINIIRIYFLSQIYD